VTVNFFYRHDTWKRFARLIHLLRVLDQSALFMWIYVGIQQLNGGGGGAGETGEKKKDILKGALLPETCAS
jgi:hypothetical protein